MRKRLTAGLVATCAAMAVTGGATPASAEDFHGPIDRHPAIPCNPYPPGKKYTATATPTSVTIRKGTNVNVVASLHRGVGSDKKPCKYHIMILKYIEQRNNVGSHRTGENGTASYVVLNVTKTRHFYFLGVIGNNRYVQSNVGVVNVR